MAHNVRRAFLAFSLNVGGYPAEIIRSAIQSIPKGQWEAAETIGYNYVGALRRPRSPRQEWTEPSRSCSFRRKLSSHD